MSLNAPEPPPVRSDKPAIWDLVKADIEERDRFGEKKYGVRLQPFNGRDALKDLYQELMDAVVYVRQTIYERDNAPGGVAGLGSIAIDQVVGSIAIDQVARINECLHTLGQEDPEFSRYVHASNPQTFEAVAWLIGAYRRLREDLK